MSASNPRDFSFALPARDDAAEGAFAIGTVALQCHPLDELDLRLERGEGYALHSTAGPALSFDPDGELLERAPLEVGRPVYDRSGFRFTITPEGALVGHAPAPLRDRATSGPRLSDPALSLPDGARIAAEQAIALGQGEVAAGLLLRHGHARSVQALLAGHDPIASCLQGWWDGLGADAREDVWKRTERAAILIAQTAEDLSAEEHADDPGWLADVAALCSSRDDLHSAARVLQRMHPESVPRRALASTDRALRALLRSLYVPLDLDDPRLQLAARQPACWWARRVDSPGDEDLP